MSQSVPAVPQPQFCPHLTVADAPAAIAYYTDVFGAVEGFRLVDPGSGRIGYAEIFIGSDKLMLGDAFPEWGMMGPDLEAPPNAPMKLHLYVADVDAVFAKALAKGAMEVRAVEDQFFGDRSGVLRDPYGYVWTLSQKLVERTGEEMQEIWNAQAAG